MTKTDDCLRVIGDIAIRWSEVESNLKELLWLYVGTDRPTFDLLFGRSNGDHIEKMLRRVVTAKEVDDIARKDALEALTRCKVIRDNRNTILHKMRSDHIEDAASLFPKLVATQESLTAYSEALSTCMAKLSLFVARREALETPDGFDEAPDADERVPTYEPIRWPPKSDRIEIEDTQ
ncbi:hypothetical protein [Aestuariivita sp.]|jgi:hypothetical protein|uniref:hypothetical protein n=1 Tax=Aestuariivita sp. TaxID=1872407 RepID=UPI00216CFC7F|nr:hypothetical protein [Aestuariivita sp.]MCE8008590.1 hypothetical protein [Aestuariivita sp.]